MAEDKKADPSSEGRADIQPATPGNEESIEKEQEAVHNARHPAGLSDLEHYGARSGRQREDGAKDSKRSGDADDGSGQP